MNIVLAVFKIKLLKNNKMLQAFYNIFVFRLYLNYI